MSKRTSSFGGKTKKSSALVFTLITLTAMLVVAIASFEASLTDQRASTDTEKSASSFQAADSGLEIVFQKINVSLKNDPTITLSAANLCNGSDPYYLDTSSLQGKTMKVYYYDKNGLQITECGSLVSDIWTLKSSGEFGGTIRAVEGDVKWKKCADMVCGSSDTCIHNNIVYGTVLALDGRCWLDRNLGASRVAISIDDAQSYGWYFQWGRGWISATDKTLDGHQFSSSAKTASLSDTDFPGHGNFITTSVQPFDWRSAKNNNLWQGVNGLNNPCPEGFYIPTDSEWAAFDSAEGVGLSKNVFDSTLKMPFAGMRESDTGNVVSDDISTGISIHWTSSVEPLSPYDRNARYHRYRWNGELAIAHAERGDGYSVRCIKE